MHVGRRDLAGPDQPVPIVALLCDGADQPGDPDPVATHGDPDRLGVGSQRVQRERVGVLAAELEDVPDLDAAGRDQSAGPIR